MNITPISRRSFLSLSARTLAVASTTVSLGCSYATNQETIATATPFGRLLVMSEAQANTLFAFVEAIIPGGNRSSSIDYEQTVRRADEEVYFTEQKTVNDVKTMLDVMEYLPIIYGEFSRFSKMPVNKRLNLLISLKSTSNDTVRAVVNNCRMISYYMYYGHESSWQAIGYDGPFAKIPQKLGEQRLHYANLAGEC